MKKVLLVCSLFLFPSLFAKQIEIEVQEVELNNKLINIISAFIEYEGECAYYSNYPKDNILSLSLRRPPQEIKDSATMMLVIEFFPDNINYHKYNNPQYISHIYLKNSKYNIYIEVDKKVMQTWSEYEHLNIFNQTGRYTNIIQETVKYPMEYDPPCLQLWPIRNKWSYCKEYGYYVKWETTQYCW